MQSILQALSWKQSAPVLETLGELSDADHEAAYDLGGTIAALLIDR